MLTPDTKIIAGLKGSYAERCKYEKLFYQQYVYFIEKGCRKYKLIYEDSLSAYHDAFTAALDNIMQDRFDGHSSLKTYLYQIFSNKSIDLVRKNTTNKQQVHKTMEAPELLDQLPDSAKTVIERLMNEELKIKMHMQLKTLGEKCREILLLFEDRLTDKEIAVHLSYNNAAVAKTTRLRCLEKLREKMRGH